MLKSQSLIHAFMPKSPETGSSEPEGSVENRERTIEQVHISLVATINKTLYEQESVFGYNIEDKQGELNTLLYVLYEKLETQKESYKNAQNAPAYKFGKPIRENHLRKEIEYNEMIIKNLERLIATFEEAIRS